MTTQAAGALPLDEEQDSRLQIAVSGLSAEQLQWVSGYAAGLAAAARNPVSAQPVETAGETLTILYGSQTGNGERVAETLGSLVQQRGYAAKITSLADYKPAALKRESLVAFVVSTHGEGDPPDDAELFHEYLLSDKAPQLPELSYTVLALGDSSYVNFCQTGREFDARLEALGARRFADLVECDLDFDEAAAAWSRGIADALPELLGGASSAPRLHAVESIERYGRSKPFPATVLVNQPITGVGSSKDVRHIELSLEGSGLTYEPGDALAVVAENPPVLVDELLEVLDLNADQSVVVRGDELGLGEALRTKLEITAGSLGFLEAWSQTSGDDDLAAALADDVQRVGLLDDNQVIDIVRRYPAAEVTPQQLADALRSLSPRSYSIASSPAANAGEVHLTVAAVRYEAFGRPHWGAASTHLADRVAEGETVPVFVERNPRFRLPEPDRAIIMIGAGTGIAPFRAFVEERIEQRASGDSWLLFGDRNADSDFLYQLEWQRYLKQGHLTRMDVAFSRDQARKIYVQDRIAANSAALYRWIEAGAAIYVCGDARHMAGDVHDALVDVIGQHAGAGRDAAERTLKELRSAGRYQRDVY